MRRPVAVARPGRIVMCCSRRLPDVQSVNQSVIFGHRISPGSAGKNWARVVFGHVGGRPEAGAPSGDRTRSERPVFRRGCRSPCTAWRQKSLREQSSQWEHHGPRLMMFQPTLALTAKANFERPKK
eukprot:5165677-Pyramimonas_sp.AAC.1